METNLQQIHRLGILKQAENLDFRRFLARHHRSSAPLQQLADRLQRDIDCTACANCCRFSIVEVNAAELDDIARYLRCDTAAVIRHYTAPDPDDPSAHVLQSSAAGCVFLHHNLCAIYAARPKACRDFPCLAPGTHSLGARFSSVMRWAHVCPVVYNVIEEFKHLVGYTTSPSERDPRLPSADRSR